MEKHHEKNISYPNIIKIREKLDLNRKEIRADLEKVKREYPLVALDYYFNLYSIEHLSDTLRRASIIIHSQSNDPFFKKDFPENIDDIGPIDTN